AAAALDPEVHRIAGDEARALDLLEHVELQARIDVRQEDPFAGAKLLWNARREVGEHAEAGLQRVAVGEIEAVHARPAEALARRSGHPAEIHPPLTKEIEGAGGEVLPDHSHHLHGM